MDLEEIMSSQSIMNSEITEIEITLDNRNSSVTEAEERLSELEDRIWEINEAELEREREREKWRHSQRPMGQC